MSRKLTSQEWSDLHAISEKTRKDCGVPDHCLIERALITLSCQPCQNQLLGDPLSFAVSSVFGIDKQQAEALCRRFDYDPELRVRKVLRK